MAINTEKNMRRSIVFSKKDYALLQKLAKIDGRSANSLIIQMVHEGLRLSPKAKLLFEELEKLEELEKERL